MDANRWRELSRLFDAARSREGDERRLFIESACRGDPLLRHELEALLAHADASGGFLEALPSAGIGPAAATVLTDPVDEPAPAVLGHFRIDRLIGRGGMGAVYLAHDTTLHRAVALKIVRAMPGAPSTHALREARSAAALNHPNICTVYEVGEADGFGFIAMEYVEGRSLRELADRGPLPAAEVVRLGVQAADALAYAHAHGVIHRDLKAANVLVTSSGVLKVVDFGLARRVEAAAATATASLVPPGMAIGTPYAMSPEQVRGEPADARTDVWGLGVLLYELAAGQKPFQGETIPELFSAILRDRPAPLPATVPAPLATIVTRCLAPDPAERCQSAADVRATLAELSTGPQMPATRRRVASRATAVGAAVVATVALAVLIRFDVGELRDRATRLISTDVVAFSERDWLLLADVENHTSDPLFDRSLETAFAVGLGQSSYVNLLPASRIDGALRRMKRQATRIDAATAREIAQREGARLVLAPSITEVGGIYQLSALLQEPASGRTIASAAARASARDRILPAIDELIVEIRRTLGEARQSIANGGRPLAEVTTGSLEALKVFSAARAALMAARIDEAITLLEEALRIDPSFTAARAQLGMTHFELRDRGKGVDLLTAAVGEVDGLSDKERFSVLAFHAIAVERSPQKAIDYYRALLDRYPDTDTAHNNIGRAFIAMGRWTEAVAALTRSLELNPYLMLTYNSLNQIYLYQLGDLESALALAQQQLLHGESPHAYDHQGWARLGKGEIAAAREAFRKAVALDPSATLYQYRLGHAYRLEQRYAEARDQFVRIAQTQPAEHDAFYDAGVAAQLLGDDRAAAADFAQARRILDGLIARNPKDAESHLALAAVLWRLGVRRAAVAAAERGLALNGALHFEYATFLSLQGRHDEAMKRLEAAVQAGFRNFVWMMIHEDLEPLRSRPDFQALVSRYVPAARL